MKSRRRHACEKVSEARENVGVWSDRKAAVSGWGSKIPLVRSNV